MLGTREQQNLLYSGLELQPCWFTLLDVVEMSENKPGQDFVILVKVCHCVYDGLTHLGLLDPGLGLVRPNALAVFTPYCFQNTVCPSRVPTTNRQKQIPVCYIRNLLFVWILNSGHRQQPAYLNITINMPIRKQKPISPTQWEYWVYILLLLPPELKRQDQLQGPWLFKNQGQVNMGQPSAKATPAGEQGLNMITTEAHLSAA